MGVNKFEGFYTETTEFLRDLGQNNNKEWFEANRYRYERYLLEPLKLLVKDIGYFMLTIDPYFEITPAVDKTIARIYRDIRFSKDKSPYRDNIWITFRRTSRDWKEDPVYFFEIFPDWYRYGMGFYMASKDTMDSFRVRINERPEEFSKAVDLLAESGFSIEGEKYKRALGTGKHPKYNEWYQRKNLYVTCKRDIDDRFRSKELGDDIMSGFKLLEHLYQFLWRVKK